MGVDMKQESEQFKNEATPVIDLKKAPVSDVWDNEKTEVYLEDDTGGGAAFLLTSEGEYIPISAFPFVIGRGNECDLVLNKKGLSRKHAEIVFQSGRFVVNDLDSLNGLKVNGYKVARVILEESDTIKLGEVNLVFTTTKGDAQPISRGDGDSNLKSSSAPSESRIKSVGSKKLIYSVTAVLVVAIAGTAGYLKFGVGIGNGLNQRIVVVPNPSEARSPKESPSPEVASNAGKEQPVVATGSQAPVEEAPASDPTAPPPSIALSLDVKAATPIEPPIPGLRDVVVRDKDVQKAASKPTSIASSVVQKPATVKKPVAVQKTVGAQKPVVLASPNSKESLVPAPAASNVDARYLSGDVDGLLKEMAAAVKSSKSADSAYQAKYRNIVSLYNKYSAGKQAYLEGRKSEAINLWSAFINEEKSLYGAKRSVMASATVSKLVDEYVALGNDAAKAGNNHEAYKYWQKSIAYGDSVAARIALDAANQKSKQLYRQALRLEYVNTERAKELWKQVMSLVPPGTEYYTKASSKLAWYEKWGA